MALLSIVSQNPDLGYVLCKNPNTITKDGPYKKLLRKGVVRGWFQNSEEAGLYRFHLHFRDHPSETSFGGEFEYLDQSRYLSPVAITSMMSLSLRDTLQGKTENYDTPAMCVVMTTLCLSPFMFDLISKNLSDSVTLSNVVNNVFKISVSSQSVSGALNLLYSICVAVEMGAGKTEDCGIELNRASMEKIIKVLMGAKAPYRLFRTILTKGINNRSLFNELKGMLPPNWNLKFGNNQTQRLDAIKTCLISDTMDRTLVDIGCGEMFNSRKLMDKFSAVVAVDQDKALMEDAPFRLRTQADKDKTTLLTEVVNREFIEGLGSTLDGAVVLMTEFLEHVEPQKAVEILNSVLAQGPAQVIITVPNRDFNVYYDMEVGEIRHQDHLWEPNLESVQLMLKAAEVNEDEFDVHFMDCADAINSDPCFFTLSLVRKQTIEKDTTHVEPTEVAI